MSYFKQRQVAQAVFTAMVAIAAGTAQAVVPTLASVPVNQLNFVEPNVMLVFDRSGSMDWEAVPDDMVNQTGWVGYYYYGCNHLAYNPSIDYSAPLKYDGSSYPNASITAAWDNGYNTGSGTTNLTTSGSYRYYYLYSDSGTAPTVWSDTNCKKSYTWGSDRTSAPKYTAVDVGTLTSAQKTNYANWYSYYRKRLLMMKTSVGRAFQAMDKSYRVGLMTIDTKANQITSAGGSSFVPAGVFNSTKKQTWYSTLYAMNVSGSTPLRQALSGVGRYYAGLYSDDPVYPHNSGGDCQQNFTLLATDGYWNTYATNPLNCGDCTADLNGNNIGNIDGTNPPAAYAPFVSQADGTLDKNNDAGDGLHAGNLSDVALYYYATNLRPTYAPRVPSKQTPAVTYSHMVTYTVGLGVAGTLKYVDDYATNTNGSVNDLVNIKAGTVRWPNVTSNASTAVDDMWHAAINGRGLFFSAGDPDSMIKGFNRALNDINSNVVHSTNFTQVSPVLSDNHNIAYKGYFQSGSWAGRLEAVLIDPATGLEVPNVAPLWKGHTVLDTQTANTGWDTGRLMFVGSGSAVAAQPFRWSNLTGTQQTVMQDGVSASFTPNYGQALLNYLRGDRTNEGTAGAQYFRARGDSDTAGTLGDIVNAKPVAVGAPKDLYTDAYNAGYSAFKTNKATRTPMVYAAANDGMVHAFNASTVGSGNARLATANSGKEVWAYVPSMVIRNTNDESGKPDGLPAYAYQLAGRPDLGKPAFTKHYLLDGTPLAADVDMNRTYGNMLGSSDWHSILVGGMGRGGKGYYALDITNGDQTGTPLANLTTETQAATKYLWEFTGDSDMGYTYGNPVITRSATYGWVAIVSSGYNSTTGYGAIWVLNAKTGAVIKKFQIAPSCGGTTTTYTCVVESGLSATNPLNLGKMTGFVTSTASEEIMSIYAGDMQGNLWRADLTDANSANWTIRKLATFTSPSGNGPYANTRQPITTEPTVAWDQAKDRRWVFVGTGMDLSADDRDSTKDQAKQQQTFYGLIDGTAIAPLTSNLPLTRSVLALDPASSTDPIDITGKQGFYIDLAPPVPASGNIPAKLAERVVLRPTANFGVVVFASNIPTLDVCSPGYTSNFYVRGYLDGSIGKSFAYDSNGNVQPFIPNDKGFAADPKLEQTSDGNVVFQTCDVTGSCQTAKFSPPNWLKQSRISWRELINN